MIEKEKAKELIDKFEYLLSPDVDSYKCTECALIVVDEVLNVLSELDMYEHVPDSLFKDWRGVKKEIENL